MRNRWSSELVSCKTEKEEEKKGEIRYRFAREGRRKVVSGGIISFMFSVLKVKECQVKTVSFMISLKIRFVRLPFYVVSMI